MGAAATSAARHPVQRAITRAQFEAAQDAMTKEKAQSMGAGSSCKIDQMPDGKLLLPQDDRPAVNSPRGTPVCLQRHSRSAFNTVVSPTPSADLAAELQCVRRDGQVVFQKGDLVERELEGCWFLARITAANADGSFDVFYTDDGNDEKGVDISELRAGSDESKEEEKEGGTDAAPEHSSDYAYAHGGCAAGSAATHFCEVCGENLCADCHEVAALL